MNERKRLLSLVLAAVLVIGMIPTTVFAEETTPSTVATVPTTVATEPVTVAEVPTTAATEPSTVATEPTTTVTEPTVPETTVPETTVPETTVPETTVPETTVPETTIPETTVPETTVPETTVTTEPTEETTVPTTDTTESTEETTEATEETEPEIDLLTPGPQVGDQIWIKSGSKVYKNHNDVNKNFHTLIGNYKIEIKKILTNDEGVAEWYEFRFTDLGIGEIALSMGGYKYVHVENTSVEEPTEPKTDELGIPLCDCQYVEDVALINHPDGCARKDYLRSTYIVEKTAEEIYADWEKMDEDTQNAVLEFLSWDDQEKREELDRLLSCTCGTEDGTHAKDCPLYDGGGFDIVYVEYAGTASNGIHVNITAPEGAFPEGTVVTVQDATVTAGEVSGVVSGDIKGIVSVDISFGAQPAEAVVVSMDIPTSQIPAGANMVQIVHMGNNGPELVGSSYLDTSNPGETVSFAATGFSSYAAVFVNGKYNAQKMSSVLQGNSRYQISTFNVDLFDYDPVKINNVLNAATSDGNGFHFTGFNIAGMGSNNGINNSASTHAKQGILQSTLLNGFPVINYLNGTNAGAASGQILFSDSYAVDGKTVYNDIPFEFIYDTQTGYYEYKSSANHAQLNDAKNRIELYADSLSTENNYVATLDLSTANGTSDLSSKTATANSFKATVSKSSEEDARLDPYVLFTVKNVAASDVGQIYIKAKVPASVGANQFQIFFNSATEANTYIHDYTPNGDWIEFVIDTANISNWSGTISSIRIDLFDSEKGSVDINGSYPIEIAQISLIKKNYDAYATRGGFYPFSKIQDSYPGNNTGFNYNTWESLFLNDSLSMARASRSIFNPAPSSETLRYEELAFGTVLEFDFYLPVSKTGLDGKDLTYYFNGDDDLWVFVDNELVLDIGGGHGAVTGSVNFSQGTWNVENANTVTGYNSGANGTYAPKNGTISDQLSSAGKHTMKIFYLERGGSVSNCFMKFNLPRTPQGSVRVKKEVVEQNGADTSVLYNEPFVFTLTTENKGADTDGEKHPLADKEFIILSSDGSTQEATTDSEGKFTLKHGQEGFFDIDENYEVTLTEAPHEISGYDLIKTTINEKDGTTSTLITVEGKESAFEFVNTYEERNVTYTYIPVNPDGCPDGKKGTVALTGDQSTATSEKVGVSETIGVRVGNPAGSTATDNNTVKFVGWYLDEACTQLVTTEATVNDKIIDPVQVEGLYPGDTFYAKFEFLYGDLMISKTGIDDLDDHEPNGDNKQEQQSTIYTVKGKSLSGVDVNMEVVIVDNGSVTIKDIPVGNYTVTEKENWSWRYDAEEAVKNVTVTGGNTATVAFNNDRNRIHWLSGDNYALNLFDGDLTN